MARRLEIGARLCSSCIHGYLGAMGVFCILFDELIEDERVALECEQWDRS